MHVFLRLAHTSLKKKCIIKPLWEIGLWLRFPRFILISLKKKNNQNSKSPCQWCCFHGTLSNMEEWTEVLFSNFPKRCDAQVCMCVCVGCMFSCLVVQPLLFSQKSLFIKPASNSLQMIAQHNSSSIQCSNLAARTCVLFSTIDYKDHPRL